CNLLDQNQAFRQLNYGPLCSSEHIASDALLCTQILIYLFIYFLMSSYVTLLFQMRKIHGNLAKTPHCGINRVFCESYGFTN
ncbi:MAG: hypothetical protein ACPHEU_08350, partial [Acidimicrobiales bacterium]